MQETYGSDAGVEKERLGGNLWEVLFTPTDIIEVRAFRGTNERKRWFGTSDELNSKRDQIERANAEGFDLYQGLNPRPSKGAGKNADITTFRAACVDIDPGKGCQPVTIDEALFLLAQSGLPDPNAIVHSGSGVQAFWALASAVDAEQWRAIQKYIIQKFPLDKSATHADKCIHDPARVMRLPGLINHKNGNTAELISYVSTSAKVHPVSVFTRPVPVPDKPKPQPQTDTSAATRARLYVQKIPPAAEGERNVTAFKVSCLCLCDFGLDEPTAREILEEWNCRCPVPLPEAELSKTFSSAKVAARGQAGAKNRERAEGGHGKGQGSPAPAKTTTNHKTLDALAAQCALIVGTTQVWHEGLGMSMPVEAFRNLYPIEGPVWLKAADKRTVRTSDIVFEPDPARLQQGQINLWRGIDIQPDPRPCPLLVDHLLKLCGGDPDVCLWITRWMAFPLQHPGSKMDSAIIMQGPPGTGKSLFWTTYSAIFGEYARKITQTTLDDSYTGWMSRMLFVMAEEVHSTKAQARRLRNVLKDWVTGETFEIREKYQVSRSERALANFCFLSNEDVPVPIDTADRRFCVVSHDYWVAPRSPEAEAYFGALGAEVADNGPARLMNHLLHVDLGNFTRHTPPPETEAKVELRELCAHSYEHFLDEWSVGDIPELPFISASLDDLYICYCHWCRTYAGSYASDKRTFGKFLRGKLGMRRSDVRYFYVDSTDTSRFGRAVKGFVSACLNRRV